MLAGKGKNVAMCFYEPPNPPTPITVSCFLSLNNYNVFLYTKYCVCNTQIQQAQPTCISTETRKSERGLGLITGLRHKTNKKQLAEKPTLLATKAMSWCFIQYDLPKKCVNYSE